MSKKAKDPKADGVEVAPSQKLQNHVGAINQIILQDGLLITSSSDGKITVWDPVNRTPTHEFRGDSKRLVLKNGILFCVSFGNFGNEPGVVSAYSLKRKAFIALYKGHALFITDMIMVDSQMYTASADHTIRQWETQLNEDVAIEGQKDWFAPEERKTRKVLYGHSGIVNCLVNLNGTIYSGSADFTIKAWNSAGTNVTTFSGHQASVTALEPTSSNTIFSGSNDETIRLWDLKTTNCIYVIKVKGATINGLSLQSEGLFAWISEPAIHLYFPKNGKKILSFEGHTARILNWKYADGYLYTVSADGTVRRWNPRRGTCVNTFRGHRDLVHSLLINGTTLYSGSSDTSVHIWNIPTEDATEADNDSDLEYDDFGTVIGRKERPRSRNPSIARSGSSEASRKSSDRRVSSEHRSSSEKSSPKTSVEVSAKVESWADFLSATSKAPATPPQKKDDKKNKKLDKKDKKNKKDSDSDVDLGFGSSSRPKSTNISVSSPIHAPPGKPKVSASVSSPVTRTPVATFPDTAPGRSASVSVASPTSVPSLSIASGPRTQSVSNATAPGSRESPQPQAPAPVMRPTPPPPKSPSSASLSPPADGDTIGGKIRSSQDPNAPRRTHFATWGDFFAAAGLAEKAAEYEALFRANAIELDQASDLSAEVLKELQIKMGHIMKIMKLVAALKT